MRDSSPHIEPTMPRTARALTTLAFTVALTAPLHAQPRAPDGCTYQRCALSLEPRWSGLALVRGTTGQTAAELGFFWPDDVRPLFAGSDSAMYYADRAVKARAVGAALTDAGAVLLALGIIRVAHDQGRIHGGAAWTVGTGAVLLGASVPLQFSADGWLSRAVWWHNARFAR